MWRTEVNVGARTWAVSTARIGLDSITGDDLFETTVIEPDGAVIKSVRHSATETQARSAHASFVADYSWQSGAVVVECLSRPWRF